MPQRFLIVLKISGMAGANDDDSGTTGTFRFSSAAPAAADGRDSGRAAAKRFLVRWR
jgi:hypothetical protein